MNESKVYRVDLTGVRRLLTSLGLVYLGLGVWRIWDLLMNGDWWEILSVGFCLLAALWFLTRPTLRRSTTRHRGAASSTSQHLIADAWSVEALSSTNG